MTEPIARPPVGQQRQRVERARSAVPAAVESDAAAARPPRNARPARRPGDAPARSRRWRGEPAPARRGSRRSSGASSPDRTSTFAAPRRRRPRARRSRAPAGTPPTSADPSAADTSAARGCLAERLRELVPAAAPARARPRCLARERTIAQPTIARTMIAAARIDAISTSKLRRAEAKTARARPIDHGDPARCLRVRVRDRPALRAVEPTGVVEHAVTLASASRPSALFSGGAKLRQRQLLARSVDHDESVEAQVGRALVRPRRPELQRPGEHAGDPPARVARRNRHHDDPQSADPAGQPFADERLARRRSPP